MLSAFKYRIYPNAGQEMRLKRSLHQLCLLYNGLRDTKIHAYREKRTSLSQTRLRALTLQWRRDSPELLAVYSQAAQNVADRVHTAFQNYFEGRARFPKNKHPKKYRSITYPQSGFKLEDGRLHLSKVGKLRIFLHREVQGTVRRLTIKHEAREWYATLITERKPPKKPKIETIPDEKIRAADMGLEKFVTLDNAESTDYPRFLRQSEEKLKTLQKRLARKRKGSKRWKQTCFQLARLHQHITRQRTDYQNKLINQLYKENDILVLEKLSIQGMLRNHTLAKSITDSSFGQFAQRASFKADILGKHFIPVDPWGTTQFCHNCLTWVPKTLSEREHKCPQCGLELTRDLNSARLIRRLGILKVRCSSPDGGSSLAEPKPLPSLRGLVSRGVEAGSPWL